MKYSSDRDLDDLAKDSVDKGWTIVKTNKNHLKWTPPGGGQSFFSATTPNSPRCVEHVKLQMRRAVAGISRYLPKDQQTESLVHLGKTLEREKIERRESRAKAPLAHRLTIPIPLADPAKTTFTEEEITLKIPRILTMSEKPAPAIPAKAPATAAEVESQLVHIRAVLSLPFDKQKKIDLVIDLLEGVL